MAAQPKPVTFPAPTTDHTARGHVEKRGRKLVYCAACRLQKPKGGWSGECAKLSQPRAWMGG